MYQPRAREKSRPAKQPEWKRAKRTNSSLQYWRGAGKMTRHHLPMNLFIFFFCTALFTEYIYLPNQFILIHCWKKMMRQHTWYISHSVLIHQKHRNFPSSFFQLPHITLIDVLRRRFLLLIIITVHIHLLYFICLLVEFHSLYFFSLGCHTALHLTVKDYITIILLFSTISEVWRKMKHKSRH